MTKQTTIVEIGSLRVIFFYFTILFSQACLSHKLKLLRKLTSNSSICILTQCTAHFNIVLADIAIAPRETTITSHIFISILAICFRKQNKNFMRQILFGHLLIRIPTICWYNLVPTRIVILLTDPRRFFCCSSSSLCVCGYICGVCFVFICSTSLLLLTPRERCAS